MSETWLKSYITDAQIHIPNYIPFRGDRSSRRRGGTLLYIHEDIAVSNISTYDDTICSAILCTIPTLSTVEINVYRPPGASLKSFSTLLQHIQSYIDPILKEKYHDMNIMGDFNFPNIDWLSLSCSPSLGHEQHESGLALLDFIQHNMLLQIVDQPTRGNNILDLFLTNNDRVIRNVEVAKTDLSDHDLVKVNLLYNMKAPVKPHVSSFESQSFRSIDLRKADFEVINQALADIDWDTLFNLCSQDSSGNDFVELVRLTVLQACLLNCPEKLPCRDAGRPKSQNSRNRFVLNRKRRKLVAQLSALKSRNPSSPRIRSIEDEIDMIHFHIKETFNAEHLRQEKLAVTKILENPKFFFSYAKRFAKSKSNVGPLLNNGNLSNDPQEMVNILQEQYKSVFSDPSDNSKVIPNPTPQASATIEDLSFTPADIEAAIDEIDKNASSTDHDIPAVVLKECKSLLSYPIFLIWKTSFSSGVIPSDLKTQMITPVFKKGDRSDASNYRPISLTSHLIKIFERVIRKSLVDHLESRNLLSRNQHGFRKGRSCLTHLLKHIDEVIQSILEGNEHDVVYLDFAKAFDKVDHEILLQKLHIFGVRGKLHDWIKDFLLNRSQLVTVSGVHSVLALVLSGVPQGSVLGPILFLIYINDLNNCLEGSSSGSFADDTRLSKSIACCSDVLILQQDLLNVIKWAKSNNMALHEDKFELLSYRTPRSKLLQELPMTAEWEKYTTSSGQDILPSNKVKDLGVHLSPDLRWATQVSEAVQSANKMANWVISVFTDRSKVVMLTLFKTMVRSRLEYSCPVWNPSLMADIKKLESSQRAFTRHISGCYGLSYWQRLKFLDLMSLQRRRERYTIMHVWKIIKGLAPNDINIESYEHIRLGVRCRVPPLPRRAPAYAKSIYDSSFAVTGPKLWNILPRSVTCAPSLESFKSRLTSHIMGSYPDLPPVPGYTSPNSNSLLDWSTGGLQQMA